jgi:hypothetical protein
MKTLLGFILGRATHAYFLVVITTINWTLSNIKKKGGIGYGSVGK